MHAALLVLASAAVGVDWGYRPLPAGGIEYIVQVEPQALDDLAAGGSEIVSHVPPELFDIRQFRITVGKQKLPRGGRVATPSKQQQTADGVQVTPASLTGGGNEHVVELDRAAIAQMKSAMDLVYEVQNVRRYRLRLAQAGRLGQTDPSSSKANAGPTSHVTEVETPSAERANISQTELPKTRTPVVATPAERAAAPPFVPKVANDPFPAVQRMVQGVPTEEQPPALPLAAKQPNTGAPERAEPMPQAREPEPLKIDIAPAVESSPRPIRPAVAESQVPPIQPADKPNSTHIAIPDSFPEPAPRKAPLPEDQVNPEGGREPTAHRSTNDPFPGEIQMPKPAEQAEPPLPEVRRPIVPAGQSADWPPASPMKPASPAAPAKTEAEAVRGASEIDPFADKAVVAPKAAPIAEPKGNSPTNDAPAWPAPQSSEANVNPPPTNRGPTDPFPSLDTNPLRAPGLQDTPQSEPKSPQDTNIGPATGNTAASSPFPSPAKSGPGSDGPSGLDPMPPAFNSLPPFNTANVASPPFGTPGTTNPPADSAKTGDPFAAPPVETTASPGGPGLAPSGPQTGAFAQPSGLQAPFANNLSSMPERFSASQPPSSQLPSFGGDAGPEGRPIAPTVERGRLSDHEEPSGPGATAAPPVDKKPWWGLTGALMVLFASLGGNAYLGWMNWDLRRQYASLLEMFKQQRANKGRA